jgi:uncharacterized DUF497 family protein
MRFTWSSRKNEINKAKHGVSFEEARSAFLDPLSSTVSDYDHSLDEQRLLLIGTSSEGRLLIISHIDLGEIVRVISARVANRRERWTYEET